MWSRTGNWSRWTPMRWRWGTPSSSRPEERVPLDGVILEGRSALDTAALTGESLPREVEAGDDVISGCVNLSGLLKVRVTKAFEESTVAKIRDLVENATSKKAKAENFITRFARYYTPSVVVAAVLLAVLPPLLGGGDWGKWFHQPWSSCHLLPLRPGDLGAPELLRRHRRGLPGGHSGEGRQTTWRCWPTPRSWSLTRPAPSPRASSTSPPSTQTSAMRTGSWRWRPWRRATPTTPSPAP